MLLLIDTHRVDTEAEAQRVLESAAAVAMMPHGFQIEARSFPATPQECLSAARRGGLPCGIISENSDFP